MDINHVKKLDNFEGIIRSIDIEKDPAKLAEFFNSIDELWPGTFTQGIKYDEKLARDFLVKRNALDTFVAFDPDDRLVGICSVHKRMEEKNVSYIGILGAHPNVLSKKYGKHLLLTAVDFSVNNGDFRQDLHTWASNMKAVPLYKKIGLQWVPDTSVYMQNFIPAILQNSFCKPFFDRHPNWYLNQKREVIQAPDENSYENMKVFYYNFEEEGDSLEVMIDRYSRSIAGIKRNIDGSTINLILKQENHELFAGIEQQINLLVDNQSTEELSLVISYEASKEITVKSSQEIVTIPQRSEIINNSFIVKDTTSDTNINRKTPSVKCNILINGEFLTLEVGMRARQLVDIYPVDSGMWLPTGSQEIPLHIQNRSESRIEGELLLWSNGNIDIPNPIIPLSLESEENIGILARIDCALDLDGDIYATVFCQVKMNDSKSRVFEVPLFISNSPGLTAGYQSDKKRVLLQNQYIRCTVHIEGARATINSSNETIMALGVPTFDYGPPFGFSEFNQVEFDHQIINKSNAIRVKLSKEGQSKPNLIFHRYFELSPGNHHISTWTEIENLGTTDDQVTTIFQPFFTQGVGQPLGNTVLAFDNQIMVTGPTPMWPAGKGDLPEGTEKYEPWICIETDDVAYYHIYETHESTADPSRGKLTTLEKKISIPALSSGHGGKSWLGYGLIGGWQKVREMAHFLVKKQILRTNGLDIKPKSFLSLDIPKEQLLLGNKTSNITISLKSFRLMPFNGELSIIPPEGWKINPPTYEISNLNLTNPQEITCEIILPEDIPYGLYECEFTFKSTGVQKTHKKKFLVFDGSKKQVIADLPQIENKRLISVSNDSIEFTSSVDFAGSLVQITHNETTYLLSNFPNIAPSLFFTKDPGGMINTVFAAPNDDLDDIKYLKEEYSVAKIDSELWSGVEYSTDIHERKSLKGLNVKVAYETLGGEVNIIRVRTTIHNPTTAPVKFISLSILTAGFNGSRNGVVSSIPIGSDLYRFTRENPAFMVGLGTENFSYFTLEKEENSLSLLKTSSLEKLVPLDGGKMIVGGGRFSYWIIPSTQTQEICHYLVMNGSKDFIEGLKEIFSEYSD
ncbi:MAG: GNAT family N-acetyltransferase [Candidatus Hodarchaeales archaeon]